MRKREIKLNSKLTKLSDSLLDSQPYFSGSFSSPLLSACPMAPTGAHQRGRGLRGCKHRRRDADVLDLGRQTPVYWAEGEQRTMERARERLSARLPMRQTSVCRAVWVGNIAENLRDLKDSNPYEAICFYLNLRNIFLNLVIRCSRYLTRCPMNRN